MLVLARWAHFSSMVVAFGGSAFWLYARAPPLFEAAADLPWAQRGTARIIRVAAVVAAFSGIVWLLATIANMSGDVGGVADTAMLHAFFFETRFGPLALVRLLLLAGLVTLTLVPLPATARFAALTITSGLLLVSQAWLGHAAEGGNTLYGTAMIVSYAVHVLAGAAWVGGLLPLLLTLIERWRSARGIDSEALSLLSRYSLMAVIAVSLIVVSGIANAAFRVAGALGVLAGTRYGDVLLIKMGLVALMLALAAFNRFVLMRRLRDIPSRGPPQLGRLRESIVVESILGVLVLGVAAVLGITPPPQ